MAIIGNSGSGKSTFLNMLGGLDRPSAGKLVVDGKDLFRLNERELVEYKRNTVGFVWQNNGRNLVPYLNAWENVRLPMMFASSRSENNVWSHMKSGDRKEQKERALRLLELVGMAHKQNSRPDQMSGGEQQRVAIAVALANNPKILLADEPTGSVDVQTGNHILDVFRKLNQTLGLTIVIVTHDRMLSKKVNRVVAIRDGKTSSELLRKPDYADKLDHIGMFEETHNEYALLDKAGRVQIPRELLERIGVKGNRVRLEVENGRIILETEESQTR